MACFSLCVPAAVHSGFGWWNEIFPCMPISATSAAVMPIRIPGVVVAVGAVGAVGAVVAPPTVVGTWLLRCGTLG